MTNAEWKELVAKEFGVSKSVARDMVSAMYSVYRRKKGKMKLIGFGLDDLADRYEATPYDHRYTTKKSKLIVMDDEDYNAICEMSSREG